MLVGRMEKQTEFSWRNLKERLDMDDTGAAETNVEMNLQGIEWEGIKVSHVAQETDICAIFQRENSRLAQKLSASKEGL